VDGKKTIRLFGEEVAVRARLFTIGGFSAHADQSGLLSWMGSFAESNPQVFVVHGENSASHDFAALVHEKLGFTSYVPGWRETLFLKPREFPIEVAAPAVEEEINLGGDMLQVYQQVARELEQLQGRIHRADGRVKITEEEIDRLRYIQEELQQILAA
jgi:metallo-beta-lactamase family protein